jgi:aspartate aminotransferase
MNKKRINYHLSRKIQQVQGSPTLALNEKARDLKSRGAAVINLGIGEPLNDFPESAAALAQNKLATRQVKYSPTGGNLNLKQSIQKYTERLYGRNPTLENIIVTVGAKQALFNLMQVLLDPGDEVIIFSPYWVSYPEMIQLAGGTTLTIPTDDNFIPNIEDLKQAISSKTRAVLLNSPNNPTGAVYPPELIAAVVDLCETQGIYLIMDDIYHQLVFDPAEWVPGYVFTSQPFDKSQLIIINGISKTYGMTGFRIGWAIGPAPVIQAMNKIQSHSTSGASALLQEAAVGALNEGVDVLNQLKNLIKTNRDILINELKKIKGVQIQPPGGTFYCFPDFRKLTGDSQMLADLLLEKAFVATVPGQAFGTDGYLRMSYTCSTAEIKECAARIRWALDPETPPEINIDGKTYHRSWEIK